MRVLVVKMSSLGDVVHTLPSLTEAADKLPGLRFDWVVEEAFAAIPDLHPTVDRVIPIAQRRWRRSPGAFIREFGAFRRELMTSHYDAVIDAQGLVKSAVVARMARGPGIGFDAASAREALSTLGVSRRIRVARDLHAIDRTRLLFAAALGYEVGQGEPDSGLGDVIPTGKEIVFLHGTTWPSKHYPEGLWAELARLASEDGYRVLLPHGSPEELARAERIGAAIDVEIMERCGLADLAQRIRRCAGALTVDSGLGHLAAALGVPQIALFGPTSPRLTRPIGNHQIVFASDHLPCIPCMKRECLFEQGGEPYPPCFSAIPPIQIWSALKQAMMARQGAVS